MTYKPFTTLILFIGSLLSFAMSENRFRHYLDQTDLRIYPNRIEVRLNLNKHKEEQLQEKFKFMKILNLETVEQKHIGNSSEEGVVIIVAEGSSLNYELANSMKDTLYKKLVIK